MKKETVFKIIGSIAVIAAIVLLAVYSYQINQTSEARVKTDKTEYQIGEPLKVKIENNLKDSICFSICYPYYFEKKDGEWKSYHYEDCQESDLADGCVEAGQVKAYEMIIPALEIGFHRLALPACVGCSAQELFQENQWFYSNDFIVK